MAKIKILRERNTFLFGNYKHEPSTVTPQHIPMKQHKYIISSQKEEYISTYRAMTKSIQVQISSLIKEFDFRK